MRAMHGTVSPEMDYLCPHLGRLQPHRRRHTAPASPAAPRFARLAPPPTPHTCRAALAGLRLFPHIRPRRRSPAVSHLPPSATRPVGGGASSFACAPGDSSHSTAVPTPSSIGSSPG